MALIFIAIDPETDSDHCPAVFVEEETGDLLFQGWTVTDPATLAESAGAAQSRTTNPWSGSRRGCGQPSWRRSVGTVPPFSELIAATASSAVHLEMRDAYTPDDQRFLDWLAGKALPCPANPAWSQLVRTHTARGVRIRRARVVSEPLADYIRFEYAITDEVKSLPGRKCAGYRGAGPQTCACLVTTSGCSMTGSSGSRTFPATVTSWRTNWSQTRQ